MSQTSKRILAIYVFLIAPFLLGLYYNEIQHLFKQYTVIFSLILLLLIACIALAVYIDRYNQMRSFNKRNNETIELLERDLWVMEHKLKKRKK